MVESMAPNIQELKNIRMLVENCISNNLKLPIHQNLMDLLTKEDILIVAYATIKGNKGATTPGSEGISAEDFSMERLTNLQTKLNNGTFLWSTVKTVMIPRPGKDPRPLGLPNFDEKIVQAAINLILTAIYDPIFKKEGFNKGFLPGQGAHDAILEITDPKNQGLHMAIEGDIKAAFPSVNHEILREILIERIDDKKFIHLIYQACKAKISIFNFNTKQTILESLPTGTPQGSIMSPILFNIYLREMDLFINNEVRNFLHKKVPIKYNNVLTNSWLKYKSKIEACKKMMRKIQILNMRRNLSCIMRSKLEYYKKRLQTMKKRRFNTTNSTEITKYRLFYIRYADDWLILTNAPQEIAEEIKEMIGTFLSNRLKLTLSPQKTLINNLKNKNTNFLGFSLFTPKKSPTTNSLGQIQRGGAGHILVGIDFTRRLRELETKKYAKNQNYAPRECSHLIHFTIQEIIDHYNSVMDGIVNYYYRVITFKSQLNRIIYILQFSCYKTLATKLKLTIRGIIKKYGWTELNKRLVPTGRKRLVYSYKVDNKTKYIILRNYTDAMDMGKWISIGIELKQISQEDFVEEDFWNKFKLNWRSTFKLTKFCTICGSQNNLESHHIKHVRKRGEDKKKITKFTSNVMGLLNRKQIVVCRQCHNRIHAGTYDSMGLADIFDVRLARVENSLRTETSTIHRERNDRVKKIKSFPIIFLPKIRAIQNLKEKAQKITNSKLVKRIKNTPTLKLKKKKYEKFTRYRFNIS
jgi:nicotine oxidoreductase